MPRSPESFRRSVPQPASVLLGAVALLVVGCISPSAVRREPPDRHPAPGWELVWSDEFEGDTLDRASWTVEVMPDPHNEELQYYPDRADRDPGANVWLEDGVLVIEARREDFEHRRYTSARINTRGKREFLYGRFEARIRQPGETGMWPAFWLLGANIGEVGWPACGEIDVMEGKGRLPRWTSGAIHAGPDRPGNRIVSFSQLLERGDVQSSWHVYAVEWEPAEIRWFADGKRLFAVHRPVDEDPAYWPFDHGHPFYLILNLAVGGWFDPGHPPPDDMAPQRLLVDWVRVYRKAQRSASSASSWKQ
jgi:beta-glucanase (GH16 family)